MCGFSGIIFSPASSFTNKLNNQENFLSQALKLKHRGNEPMRKLIFDNLFLSHFRLAFQDIALNFQPMLSKNKKWVIVFNGEVYNFPSLRKKIEEEFNYSFKTHSDTEVILETFLHYGLKIQTLLEGEYSIVICATDGTEVFALRDPFGVKPLFLALEDVQTKTFANAQESYLFKTKSIQFASEIKGLVSEKKWDKEGFLRQFVGLYEPIRTPFQNIIQLPPNSFLYGKKQGDFFSVKIQLQKKSIRNLKTQKIVSKDELYSEFAKCLHKSVEHRMRSEVELGIYLSGGIDSKAVAYEAVKYCHKHHPSHILKSFTICFKNEEYNESSEALAFSQKIGLSPNILKINDEDLAYSYKHAVYYSENVQPYTNGAAKWWLSRFTGTFVNGVLTGDGADELLGGYPSFRYANWWKFALQSRPEKNIFDKIKKLPIGNSWRDSVYLKKFSNNQKDPWIEGSSAEGTGEDFIESLHMWGVPHPLFGQIKTITTTLLGVDEGIKWLKEQKDSVSSWFAFGFNSDDPEFLMNPDNAFIIWQNYFCKTHLPVQILNWVGDRMEMANTIEGRTPFLSREMKSFIYKLKDNELMRGFEEKSILKRSYQNKMGKNFAMTPKRQFGAPFLLDNNTLEKLQSNIILKANETQLFESKNAFNLFQFMKNNFLMQKTSAHTLTHLKSVYQTLICFSLIDDSIVKGKLPERDYNYEERVISSQKIF